MRHVAFTPSRASADAIASVRAAHTGHPTAVRCAVLVPGEPRFQVVELDGHAAVTCAACGGSGVRPMPHAGDLVELPCPVCKPGAWPQGFPGERYRGDWIIPPYEPGGTAVYVGWPLTPEVALTTAERMLALSTDEGAR